MKAIALTALNRMEFQERPDPQIRDDHDVLVRIAAVGVCGSDIHYYRTGRIGIQVVEYPFLVGHECSARVEAVGPGVTGVQPGQRIAVEPAHACGECDQCRAGRPHTCRHLRYLGCPHQMEGCLCELMVLPEENCFPIPDSLSYEDAAFVEPLSIGCYAAVSARGLAGKDVAILGAGPIGLSVLLAVQKQQPASVLVSEPIAERRAMALQLGADIVCDPSSEDVVARTAETHPLLLDAIFECCGEQEALDQSLKMLKPGGQLLIAGIPETDRVSFSIDDLRHREINIQNVRRQNGCVPMAIEIIEKRFDDIRRVVTHRYPFERTQEAFDLVADYNDGVVKAMINMPGVFDDDHAQTA